LAIIIIISFNLLNLFRHQQSEDYQIQRESSQLRQRGKEHQNLVYLSSNLTVYTYYFDL